MYIPNSVTSISSSAFSGCSALTSVSIPNSVTSIGSYAFCNCSGLTSVSIPNSVTSIDTYTFRGCSGLISVSIPNSVTSIGDYAFEGCSGLTSISIPSSVTSIGNYAFNQCYALKELSLEDGTETLSLGCTYDSGRGLFYYCPIEKLYLGRNLSYDSSSSGRYSPFYNKTKLADLTIGENVTALGMSCFSGCSAIKQFHSQSYNIEGLDKSGLTSENVLAIITPDELNQETIDKISQSNLTYFKNLLIENGGKTYSVITAPNYINISGCVINNATTQLVAYDNTAIAISSSGSIGNAYFRGVDVRDRITFGGVSFKPSSLWEENIFNISEKSGVVGITIDDGTEQEVEFYDLKGSLVYKGLRSEVRLQRGIYIVRQGSKVAKIYIK